MSHRFIIIDGSSSQTLTDQCEQALFFLRIKNYRANLVVSYHIRCLEGML